jgi:two-component system response regulator ChvI
MQHPSPPSLTPNPSFGAGVTHAAIRPIHVAFVEDDDDFRAAASSELGDYGFVIEGFRDGVALLASLAPGALTSSAPTLRAPVRANPEIILLDWSLPSVSGIELLPRLRRAGIALPVVFLTGRSQPVYEKAALEGGAVDFVDKARGVPILAQRLRLIANSARKPAAFPRPDDALRCGRLTVKVAASRALWDDRDVGLTVTEFKIVHLLATNAGTLLSYRAIYDCMHYEGFIGGNGDDGYRMNVRSCIKRIRHKFLAVDPDFAGIENVPSSGYCWRKA